MPPPLPRRSLLWIAVAVTLTIFLLFRSLPSSNPDYAATPIHHVDASQSTLHGDVIMPKLGNETEKAELGRAAWKLFHTVMARFPDEPTEDESIALDAYIHLFARLYPCGECAGHFRKIIEKYPPQTSSRSSAAAWACHVHNVVNKSLKKTVFDCSKIGDFYKCGCAHADDEKAKGKDGTKTAVVGGNSKKSSDKGAEKVVKPKNDGEGTADADTGKKGVRMKLEREGWTRGG